MKKIVLLLVSIVFISISTIAFAEGVIGRVTNVVEGEYVVTVFLSLDPNATEPSSGDSKYLIPITEKDAYLGLALRDVVKYAYLHKDEYNCFISYGTTSGGVLYVRFAQLVPRIDSLKKDINILTLKVNSLTKKVNKLEQVILK